MKTSPSADRESVLWEVRRGALRLGLLLFLGAVVVSTTMRVSCRGKARGCLPSVSHGLGAMNLGALGFLDRIQQTITNSVVSAPPLEEVVLSVAAAGCSNPRCRALPMDAAGSSPKRTSLDLRRTVIVTQVSFEYVDFLENWYISVAQQGYANKVLFIADDPRALKYLRSKWPMQTVDMPDVYPQVAPPQGSTSAQFNTIVQRRPFYLKALLDLNVTVLYNDVDMVWLQDPFEYLSAKHDLMVQEDGRLFQGALERFPGGKPAPALRTGGSAHQMCTCFMLIQPREASMKALDRWGASIRHEVARLGKAVANQVHWNKAVLEMGESEIDVAVLPVMQFPSGCIYFGGLRDWCKVQQKQYFNAIRRGLGPTVVVHNNWYPGHEQKLRRFKSSNLWLVSSHEQDPVTLPSLSGGATKAARTSAQ